MLSDVVYVVHGCNAFTIRRRRVLFAIHSVKLLTYFIIVINSVEMPTWLVVTRNWSRVLSDAVRIHSVVDV